MKCSIKETFVTAVVDTDDMRVMAIHAEAITIEPEPVFRLELTEDEKTEAIAIAEAEPYIQEIMAHVFTLGEPNNSSPVLGADPSRVAWLPLEEDPPSDQYRGVIVCLDDAEDLTVMWGGDLPSWWPY